MITIKYVKDSLFCPQGRKEFYKNGECIAVSENGKIRKVDYYDHSMVTIKLSHKTLFKIRVSYYEDKDTRVDELYKKYIYYDKKTQQAYMNFYKKYNLK